MELNHPHNTIQPNLLADKDLTSYINTVIPGMENSPPISRWDCSVCNYRCDHTGDWHKHLKSKKHQRSELQQQQKEIPVSSEVYMCKICNKEYKSRNGLWKHNNTSCSTPPDITTLLLDVVRQNIEVIRQNSELHKLIIDGKLMNQQNTYTTTTNTNSHNKTFNLNVFLNEDCKDAMNLTDFVDSFQMQLSDLEQVGELGYVAGMSKIIMAKLNALDVYKRPIHCTDVKRDTLHIKDGDKWEKDKGNKKLRQAIKRISKKNSDLLLDWKDEHPGSQNPDNRFNDQYLRLIIQSMGGSGEIEDSETKIIKNNAKHVVIEK